MDTGTHFVTGLGLAGLAHIDPAVATDVNVALYVLIGIAIGSQAPDLDSLTKLKGNGAYIRNHRGLTHSILAIAIWTIAITGALKLVFGNMPLFTVGLWVGIAVCVHIVQDLFNAYGTQVLRPFSRRWIAWNVVPIFDPFIFFTHLFAIAVWVFRLAEPTSLFPTLYSLIVVYYCWRCAEHFKVRKRLATIDDQNVTGDGYMLIPTMHPRQWNVVKIRSHREYCLGEWKAGRLTWVDRILASDHPAVEASKLHPDITALLSFSPAVCPILRIHRWGYEVRWIDVRYRHRKHYPFVGVLLLNDQLEPLEAYVGWLSDTKLEKKLRFDSHG